MSVAPEVREYLARARSTDTFGRVLCSCRNHHFVVDGPVWNGCPGEAVTPGELFLGAVAACAVELVHVIARERGDDLERAEVSIRGTVDRSRPVRPDLTLFNSVRLDIDLEGVSERQAEELVEAFKGR
jgi:uncharacterized OsmC-like protein